MNETKYGILNSDNELIWIEDYGGDFDTEEDAIAYVQKNPEELFNNYGDHVELTIVKITPVKRIVNRLVVLPIT